MSSYSERQRKRYAEDAEYRKAVLARNRTYRAAHRKELNAPCHPCNAALGFMRDDPVIAAAATEYLRNAKREDEPR